MNILIFLFLFFATNVICKSNPRYCLSEIPKLVEQAIMKRLEWRVGVLGLFKTPSSKEYQVMYSHDEEKLFLPASNTKVMTTTSTLIELGSNFRYSTKLYPANNGSVCLKLMGDPSFSYKDLELFSNMIKYTKLNNSVEVDFTSYFGEDILECPGTWELDDLPYYYSAFPTTSIININHDIATISPGSRINEPVLVKSLISPISLEFDTSKTRTVEEDVDTVSFRVELSEPSKIVAVGEFGINRKSTEREIAILEPDTHFLRTLELFLENKVKVTENICSDEEPFLFQVESDILLNLLNYTLQISDNTYAELFLRKLGAIHRNEDQDAFTAGLEYIQNHYLMNVFGVDNTLFRMNDGSGMSRQTFLSPKALATVLEFMKDHYPIYKYILPQGGRTGTLKYRFLSNKGIVYAKTGTLTGVGALSGYIEPFYIKEDIIFSILINNSLLSASEVRETIDEIVLYFAFADPNC